MDFTREPIVETIITPREGFRLVIRSSKNLGQEEFAVDALEVVSFGTLCFYRHLERPRPFLVPASDYEVFEIRETRMPLKAASFDGAVRQVSPKENARAPQREQKVVAPVKEVVAPVPAEISTDKSSEDEPEEDSSLQPEERSDRRKDRKRGTRRRRGSREDIAEPRPVERPTAPLKIEAPAEMVSSSVRETPVQQQKTFLPPPPTLIRDDLDRLRKSEQYRGAFYVKDDDIQPKVEKGEEEEEVPVIPSHLQEEEAPVKIEEESVYKATPLPPEEDEMRPPLWISGGSLGPDKQ